ncbi:MAG: hypothetical protein ABIW84_07505 [Ilumatobacteraceae bacterium]
MHFHRRAPVKESVRVATTANITIATALNNGDTLDGITLATDDRVLVKDQSTGSQNGIYIVAASPVRAYDQSTDDPAFGFLVYVREGTVGGGKIFRNTNIATPTIDTTSLTFAESGSSLTIKDEGSSLATAATSIDFVGAGVVASGAGAAKTVTIAGGAATLDDLTDVVITSATVADRLRYNGTNWVNSALIWQPLTDGVAGSPELIFDAGDVVMTEG